jgi:hypothetical protein
LYIQEFIRFARQEEEDSRIQRDQRETDPDEIEALGDRDREGVMVHIQKFIRFVGNEESEPQLQTEQAEEDPDD